MTEQELAPYLEAFRKQYLQGRRLALIETIAWCARHRVAPPDWAVDAFLGCCDQVLNFKVRSWDDVFGTPCPKGMSLKKARLIETMAPKIVARICAERLNGKPLDNALFEEVGEQFGLKKTQCAELYYFGAEPRRRGRGRKMPRF